MKGWFITGTDTDCGKTLVASGLVHKLRGSGQRVAVMKPVAAGCVATQEGLRNADAQALIAAAGEDRPYELINPYALAPAIAPHIAAAQADVAIDLEHIVTAAHMLAADRDVLVVEGAGGWRVPLGEGLDVGGIARALQLPVILVVGMRLGCLNHAMLTAEAIEQDGCRVAGWVANTVDPAMGEWAANLLTLQASIAAPCLGVIPNLPDIDAARVAQALSLPGAASRM